LLVDPLNVFEVLSLSLSRLAPPLTPSAKAYGVGRSYGGTRSLCYGRAGLKTKKVKRIPDQCLFI
jgi:hypothetical protein